jgi:hypothetical protein
MIYLSSSTVAASIEQGTEQNWALYQVPTMTEQLIQLKDHLVSDTSGENCHLELLALPCLPP